MTQMIQVHPIRATCLILVLIMEPASGQSNVKSTKDPSCISPCSCCLVTAPCSNCGGQCVDGILGGQCKNTCPTNCIRCTDHPNAATDSSYWNFGYCTECKDGHYATSQFYQCQLECLTECKTCNSYTDCTSCKGGYTLDGTMCRQCKTGCALCQSYDICTQCDDGYYNSGGTANNLNCVSCSSGCSIQCDRESGTCPCRSFSFTGDRCDMCIDGMTGEDCNIPCQTGCATCTRTSGSECTSCINGHYLQGNTCPRCKPGCAQCSSYNNCTLCMDEYYSSVTDCVACSNGCSNQCDQGTGTCNCKYGFDGARCDRCITHFIGTKCDKCSPGYFGTSCTKACQDTCIHDECERNTGTCTQGCIENFFGATCNDCVEGRYGQDCSLQCPENCDGACIRSSGYCQGCKTNFSGNTCDECSVGKHGSDCGLACMSGCKDNNCDRGTGTCASCQDGIYGELCNLSCPPQCLQITCQQKTGACIGGCTSGYSGDMCCLKGSSCKSCSSVSQCEECLPGKYDDTCNSQCPVNCADNICSKNNGTCSKCTDGFQGPYCTVTMTVTDSSNGTSGAAIGAGVTGGLLVIIVVAGLLIVYMRRQRRMSDDRSNRQTDAVSGNPTYINVIRGASNETQQNWKIIQEKTQELQKYQRHILKHHQKETTYTEKAARLQHELNEMKGHPNNQTSEEGADSGAVNSTYESLDQQEAGDHPYAALRTK